MDFPRVTLTDAEWMSLIDGTRDGGLTKCCANVSALRDCIIGIARDGGEINPFTREELRLRWGWVDGDFADGHDTRDIPALTKLLTQVGIDPDQARHEPAKHPDSLI